MQKNKCTACGSETVPDAACPSCGDATVNGAAKTPRVKPAPPAEVASWVIERPTPEMLEDARRTFDAAEYLAGVREIEAGGGQRLEDFIEEVERIANGKK